MSETFVVKTNYGPVRGVKRTSHVGDEFVSFRGIPYAQPPLGALRFKDPQPPTPWVLPRDATQPGHIAVAINKLIDTGADKPISPQSDEDCLTLNVYTRTLTPDRPQPVMVFIHGGGFKTGSADELLYSPDYLLRHDVVFVSINYRLGALGFLSIADPSVAVPGNAGLKDQTLALRWVRANIAAFGGDAANVTLFGESAGGVAVHLHMLSELSRGLFDRAIVQSGAAQCPFVCRPNLNWGARLAKRLGWTGEGGARGAYDYLKEADAQAITRAQDELCDEAEKLAGHISFTPTPEPYRSEQTFLDQTPDAMHSAGRVPWSRHVPLLIGGTADEGLLFAQILRPQAAFWQSAHGVQALLPAAVLKQPAVAAQVAQRIVDRYYPSGVPAPEQAGELALMRPLLQMWGDRQFWHGIQAAVDWRLRDAAAADGAEAAAPTFLYRFAKDSRQLNQLKVILVGEDVVGGVCHGDELLYLFRPQMVETVRAGSADALAVEQMTRIWTQFARTGRAEIGEGAEQEWPAVDAAHPEYRCVEIGAELRVIGLPEAERIAFWNEVLQV